MQATVSAAMHFYRDVVAPWIEHHPHDQYAKVRGIDLVIREKAKCGITSDQINICVLVSPENKLDGVLVEAKAKHAWRARAACMKKLEDMVAHIYHT